MEKLIIDGVWKTRPGELKPVEFEYKSDAYKHTYVLNILQIPEDGRSTFEKIILNRYINAQEFTSKSIPTTKVELTQVDDLFPIEVELEEEPDDQEAINNIPNLTKSQILDYLKVIFEEWYPQWEWDLKATSTEKFIDAVSNEYKFNKFDQEMIKAYKKNK